MQGPGTALGSGTGARSGPCMVHLPRGRCGASHRAEPCFPGAGARRLPLTASATRFARPGHLPSQPLPSLGFAEGLLVPGRVFPCPLPARPRHRPCGALGRLALAWAWARTGAVCSSCVSTSQGEPASPFSSCLHLSLAEAGRSPAPLEPCPDCQQGSGGPCSVRAPLRAVPAALSRARRGGCCRLVPAPCAGHRRIRLGTGFCAEAVARSGAGSCGGGELMSVCVCPRRQPGPRAKALLPRRVAGPLPEGHPPIFAAG